MQGISYGHVRGHELQGLRDQGGGSHSGNLAIPILRPPSNFSQSASGTRSGRVHVDPGSPGSILAP